ncbi:hypothetical protein IJ579_03060 [bacterium]|nr:hypothetical protein [bacterium]
MDDRKRNVLIVGSGAVASSLANKLYKDPLVNKIFVARGKDFDSAIYENVDIAEDDLTGLLMFVLENKIDLTIPVSQKSFKTDIVSFFQSNGQNIFGPVKRACQIAINKINAKKLLYKIHAKTSKFGIFDKIPAAIEYLETSAYPVVIQTTENFSEQIVCPTIKLAAKYLTESISFRSENDILIEDYIYGHNFTVYFITDGYCAVPFSTVGNYKFSQDGDGGILTNGLGCYTPDYKIGNDVLSELKNVVENTLKYLEKSGNSYSGILGLDCVLTKENDFYINGFKPFLQDYDSDAVWITFEDDLLKIFDSCINGFFSDEYDEIKTNNLYSVSVCVQAKQPNVTVPFLNELEDINYINIKKSGENFVTTRDKQFVLTRFAKTLTRAKSLLQEDLEYITFDGMKYRKDVVK